VQAGTVTFVSAEKSFGFVRPDADSGTGDVFLHPRLLQRSGIANLMRGQRVEFQPTPSRNKAGAFEASDIRLLPDAPPKAATSAIREYCSLSKRAA
jgi:cold shock CspA family protein